MKEVVSVGVVHFMAYPEATIGTEKYLQGLESILCDPFFSAVEVMHFRNDKIRTRVAKLLEQSRVIVGYSAGPQILSEGLDLSATGKMERNRAVRLIHGFIDEAQFLGANLVGLVSGPDPAPGCCSEKAESLRETKLRNLKDSLIECCDYASKKGITIALELFDRDVDRRRLIGSTQMAVDLASDLKQSCDNFGLLLDLGHIPLMYESIIDAVRLAAPYLVHVHIGNCVLKNKISPVYGDQHPRFGQNDSEIDVPELAVFLQSLVEVGYIPTHGVRDILPVIAFEIKPQIGENPDIVLAGAKRTLCKAWSKITK